MGRCTRCRRARPVRRVQRYGGGSYKRGGRWYWGGLCRDCCDDVLRYASETSRKAEGYDVATLRRLWAD